MFACPYCAKPCRTERGVTQHINQSPECLSEQQREISSARAVANRQQDPTNQGNQTAEGIRRSGRLKRYEVDIIDLPRRAPRLNQNLVPERDGADDAFMLPDDDQSATALEPRAPIRTQDAHHLSLCCIG